MYNIYGDVNMNNKEMAQLDFGKISVLKQNWRKGRYFSYETRKRPYCGICYVQEGEILYKNGENTVCAVSGDTVLLKNGANYRAVFNGECTRDILINFDGRTPRDEEILFSDFRDDIVILKNHKNLHGLFNEMSNYYNSCGRECMVKSIMYRILDGLCDEGVSDEIFVKIKDIIKEDVDFSLKEEDIAKKCSVSVSTLQRTFKKYSGKTVTQYKNELRIARAKELLISGAYSVEAIAGLLNFCDSAYFVRVFKKLEGISPKKFLKKYYNM